MTDKTESFALILPSDASPSLHPENTVSSWQVALPHAIHLSSEDCLAHVQRNFRFRLRSQAPLPATSCAKLGL